MAAKQLVRFASGVVDEAIRDDKNSFISRHWARHRRHGFNRDMTQRVAQCLIDIVCVKFGFDMIQVAAANVPSTQDAAFLADWVGLIIVFSITLYWGVWLKFAVDFRADERARIRGNPEGSTRIGMTKFSQLYYKPLAIFLAVLYVPELFKLLVGTGVKGIVMAINTLFGSPDLLAATVLQCPPVGP